MSNFNKVFYLIFIFVILLFYNNCDGEFASFESDAKSFDSSQVKGNSETPESDKQADVNPIPEDLMEVNPTPEERVEANPIPKKPVANESSMLWSSKDYSLVFSATPLVEDIGKDPKLFFKGKWSNGHTLHRYIATSDLKIAHAPDGSPAAHVSYVAGTKYETPANIIGNQLGPKGPEAQVVYSVETYFECIDGKEPKLHGYMGHGHHWASADHVNSFPGGSVNRDDSWSLRVPLSKSGYYATYAYIPDKTVVYGRTFVVADPKPKCGRWEKMEVEIIQNNPVSKKNGIIRMYLNDVMILEAKKLLIRTKPTVRPKGLGYFIQPSKNNSETLNIYHRNWKIYLK